MQLGATDPGVQVAVLPPASRENWEEGMSDELTPSNSEILDLSVLYPKISTTMDCFSKELDRGRIWNKIIEHREKNFEQDDTKAESCEPFRCC